MPKAKTKQVDIDEDAFGRSSAMLYIRLKKIFDRWRGRLVDAARLDEISVASVPRMELERELDNIPGMTLETEALLREQFKEQVAINVADFRSTATTVTREQLQNVLNEWSEGSGNMAELTAMIAETYGGARNDTNAESIARTEVSRSLNSGSVATWQRHGVKKKEWLASDDSCEFCLALNGRVVGINEPFVPLGSSVTGIRGGNYKASYLEVSHPPLHPKCRCTVLPVLENEE